MYFLNKKHKRHQSADLYNKQILNKTNDKVVFISGLGKYSQKDLDFVSNEITKMFEVKCEIISPKKTNSGLYDIDGKLDFGTCERLFNCRNKTVYVTNEYMAVNREGVCGATSIFGNCILVCNRYKDLKNTVLHEVAHTLGLRHCKNKCIMLECNEIKGDNTLEFCNDCKLKLKTNLK